jgi:predicted phosphodiesterase
MLKNNNPVKVYLSRKKNSIKQSNPRIFADVRPHGIRANFYQKPSVNEKFQPLPDPSGVFPYHLSLDDVLPVNHMSVIRKSGGMTFHIVGDTGGVKFPEPQKIVSMAMVSNFEGKDLASRPAFFYHLGDVVYYNGESSNYFDQFYNPYSDYNAPIFAIPGNHDGDVDPNDANPPHSLEAFVKNFCSSRPNTSPDSREAQRQTMTQPNVYWTLDTPYATLIGLYSNVPSGGQFEQEQIDWFINELKMAPKNKAVLVSVHHPTYTASIQHDGGSQLIEDVLDNAFQKSRRFADVVFAGHVHNYQRFTRELSDRQIPYIVAGAGGYWHLHKLHKKPDGTKIDIPFKMPDDGVTLENYCDDRHGYMLLKITPDVIIGEYYAVARPHESWSQKPQKIDSFQLDLKQHKLTQIPSI